MRPVFFSIDFAWKDLLHRRGQALLHIVGLALVVFCYIILVSLKQTMQDLARENNLNRNLIILPSDVIEPDEANIEPEALQAVERYSPAFVSRVSSMIFRQIRIDNHFVQLRAVSLSDLESVYHLALIDGNWPQTSLPSATNEALVGEGAARAFGWGVGSILRIYGQDFRVAGVFRSPGTAFTSVWIPMEVAQAMYAPRRSSQFLYVQVAVGADADQVRLRLQNDPYLTGRYTVYLEDSFTRQNNQALEDIASLMRVTSLIALLSIVFGTYTATGLSLAEQSREMGILRAVGFGSSSVRGFLLIRALLLGLLASTAGLGAAWVYISYHSSTAPMVVFGWPLIYRLAPSQILAAMGWVSVLSPLGAWLSSRPFLREPVTQVLRRSG